MEDEVAAMMLSYMQAARRKMGFQEGSSEVVNEAEVENAAMIGRYEKSLQLHLVPSARSAILN